jgi:hypothetical protein
MENSIEERMSHVEKGTHKLFQIVFKRLDNLENQITPKLHGNRRKISLKDN